MAQWLRRTAGTAGAAGAAAALAVGGASRRWQAATEGLVERLMGAAVVPARTVSFQALDPLPVPVRRYFRLVLGEGQSYVRSARVRQEGHFRSKETADNSAGWRPFEPRRCSRPSHPDSSGTPESGWPRWWTCGCEMAMSVEASMVGSVLAVARVVEEADGPELRAGALQSFLAESVWFPTALLPSDRLTWSPMDDSHARATLTDLKTSVALEFEFAPGGEIIGTYTSGRQRAGPGGGGTFVTLPWGGRYGPYQEQEGMRVPVESEVYWMVDGREQHYYRGRNVMIEYDFGGAADACP